jgi:hypothetical protein
MSVNLKPIDIVFLIDVTGDMEPVLSAVKAMLNGIIDELQSEMVFCDWRARVVGFRDINGDGDDWLVMHPFVRRNPDAISQQIDSLTAFGGWDTRESLLDALLEICHWGSTPQDDRINESEWRHRSKANTCILLVTNADFHPSSKCGGNVDDVLSMLISNKLQLMFVVPSSLCYEIFESSPYSVCLGWLESPFTDNFIKGIEDFGTLALRSMFNRYGQYVEIEFIEFE